MYRMPHVDATILRVGVSMNIEITRASLSALVTIGLGLCMYLLFCVTMPDASRDIILVIIGAMVATFKDVFGYYFGSSEGSTRKTEILNNEKGNPVTPGNIDNYN
jgi:CDP-diglyceride synthetase